MSIVCERAPLQTIFVPQFKKFRLSLADDLMQIVSRLAHSQDVDSSCRVAKQILDFLELHTGDYHLNQVSGTCCMQLVFP